MNNPFIMLQSLQFNDKERSMLLDMAVYFTNGVPVKRAHLCQRWGLSYGQLDRFIKRVIAVNPSTEQAVAAITGRAIDTSKAKAVKARQNKSLSSIAHITKNYTPKTNGEALIKWMLFGGRSQGDPEIWETGAPSLFKMKKPLTKEQAEKIVERYPRGIYMGVLVSLDEKWRKYRYEDTYRAFLRWADNEMKRHGGQTSGGSGNQLAN